MRLADDFIMGAFCRIAHAYNSNPLWVREVEIGDWLSDRWLTIRISRRNFDILLSLRIQERTKGWLT